MTNIAGWNAPYTPASTQSAVGANATNPPPQKKVAAAPANTPEGQGVEPESEATAKSKSPTALPAAQENESPTVAAQTDINKVLEPYINEMMQLGPEYSAEMEFLKPYLDTGDTGGIPAQPAYTGPGAALVNSTQGALAGAETNTANAIESEKPPGFGGAAKAGEEYENSLLYQQPEQAALAYQKYLQTYGGLQPNTAGWNNQAAQAYQDILGSNATGSGLPSTADSAAAQAAAQIAGVSSSSTAAGGNVA